MTIQDTVNCPYLQIDRSWFYLTEPSIIGYYYMGEGVRNYEGDLLKYVDRDKQSKLRRIIYMYREPKINKS